MADPGGEQEKVKRCLDMEHSEAEMDHKTPSQLSADLVHYENVISVFSRGSAYRAAANDHHAENADLGYEAGPPLTNYHCAVEEFLEKNRAFRKALDLYEVIGQSSTDDDLRRWFLQEDFKKAIGKLREFHQSLEKELDMEGHDGPFYDVIIKNKSNFLQYCHVVVQTHNLNEKILRKDASMMRKQLKMVKPIMVLRNQPPGSFFLSAMDLYGFCFIHWIQQDKTVNMIKVIKVKDGLIKEGSKKVYKTMEDVIEDKRDKLNNEVGRDFANKLSNFDSLLALPFQHLTRQELLLQEILKEGKRDTTGLQDDVLNGIEAARDSMRDVNSFVNAYLDDSQYMEDIDDAFKHIFPTTGSQGDDYKLMGGYKKFSKNVHLRLMSDGDKFSRCLIFAFEEHVLILNRKESDRLNLQLCVKVCNLDDVKLVPFKKLFTLSSLVQGKSLGILQVNGGDGQFGHARAKQSMSFEIKGELKALEELEKKFKDLMRPNVSKCCGELGEYAKPKLGPRSMLIEEEMCTLCHGLLQGRINLGLRCPSCKRIYHKGCYEGELQCIHWVYRLLF